MACCGKMMCSGCFHADVFDNHGHGNIIADEKCPFSRTPDPTTEEVIKSLKKRMEADDPYAFALMGNNYYVGNTAFRAK